MLSVDELFVTQKKIRNYEQLNHMIEFVRGGGFFTTNCLSKHPSHGKTSPLIEVTVFEDGKHFLHDGHHRASAILLGGREFLDKTEYRIREFTYENYFNPNLKVEWWTPFDPRTEVRLSDMTEYKNLINKLVEQNSEEETILRAIEENKQMYVEKRGDVLTLRDFVGCL